MEIVKKKCPYCNEVQYVNIKVYANHVKWCKANPLYEENKKRLAEKVSKASIKKKLYTLKCEICGKEYNIQCTEHRYLIGDYKKTCSVGCAHKLMYLHSDKEERYKKVSKTLRKFVEENKRKNGDLEYTAENQYEKTCEYCGKKFTSAYKKRRFCCMDCMLKQRTIEQLKKKEIREVYKSQCRFLFSLSSYPEEFDSNIIKENGWYKAKNHGDNINGVSRDHMLSINDGFKQKIDPYFISHPANCQIILQRRNASKGRKSSITFEELKERIKIWETKYGVFENKIKYEVLNDFLGYGPLAQFD